jgi:mono/diheme cytochrome c family protein
VAGPGRRVAAGAVALGLVGGLGWLAGRASLPNRPPVHAAAAPAPAPSSDPVATVAAGRILFMRYCAFCHGPDGRGGGLPARGLTPAPTDLAGFAARRWSDRQLFDKISAGEPGTAMPAWGKVLSEAERWQIVAFIRTEIQKG